MGGIADKTNQWEGGGSTDTTWSLTSKCPGAAPPNPSLVGGSMAGEDGTRNNKHYIGHELRNVVHEIGLNNVAILGWDDDDKLSEDFRKWQSLPVQKEQKLNDSSQHLP